MEREKNLANKQTNKPRPAAEKTVQENTTSNQETQKTELRASSPALTIRDPENASTRASELPKELLLLLTTTTEEIPVPPHKDVRAHTRTTRNAPQTREEKQTHLLEEHYQPCCAVMRVFNNRMFLILEKLLGEPVVLEFNKISGNRTSGSLFSENSEQENRRSRVCRNIGTRGPSVPEF
jgi:hypothetical protein